MKPLKLFLMIIPFCSLFMGSCYGPCAESPYVYLDTSYKNFIPYQGSEQLKFLNTSSLDTQILALSGFQTVYYEMADYAAEGRCPPSKQYECYLTYLNGNQHNYQLKLWQMRGEGYSDPPKVVMYFYYNESVQSALQADVRKKTKNGIQTVEITTYSKTDSLLVGNKYYYDVYQIGDYWHNNGIWYNQQYGLLRIWEGNQNLIRVE